MNEHIKWEYNVREALKSTGDRFKGNLEEANKIWFGAIRLMITLSSSFLLLSIAVAEKMFTVNKELVIPKLLIVGWVSWFLSIIFGVVTELEGSIFFANLAREDDKFLKWCLKKLAQGQEYDEQVQEEGKSYIVDLPILWGALSIDFFMHAIICLCSALLVRVFSTFNTWIAWGIGMVFLVAMNVYLLRKRKKNDG